MRASIAIDRVVASCCFVPAICRVTSDVAAKPYTRVGDACVELSLVEHAAFVTILDKSYPASTRLATESSPPIVLTVKDVSIDDSVFLSSLRQRECHSIHLLRAWGVQSRV